jgi:hypothetical protein
MRRCRHKGLLKLRRQRAHDRHEHQPREHAERARVDRGRSSTGKELRKKIFSSMTTVEKAKLTQQAAFVVRFQ